jgi:hypothetical protein
MKFGRSATRGFRAISSGKKNRSSQSGRNQRHPAIGTLKNSLSNQSITNYSPPRENGVMDFVNKFTDIFETGDVSSRLRPKYNLKQPEDLARFNKFIYDSVDSYNKQKFVKSKHSKFLCIIAL